MKIKTSSHLPVEAILPQLRRALAEHSNAILQAPPGAGNTTLVPLALLDAPWLAGQKILLLEPRRLAARAAARRMAMLLGESLGEQVGYRMRGEHRIGSKTRIEVITEGILTRMLQNDPELKGVGLVIFDEFHERSLHADLGLALCLESQGVLREDLRLLVMSATLQGMALANLLPDCVALASEGRCYPVELHYVPPPAKVLAYEASFVANVVMQILATETGSLLLFLPGVAEIRTLQQRLLAQIEDASVVVLPLYANLSTAEQDRAIQVATEGERKIVLATTLAETSLTIEGVRVVLDCGYKRVPAFEPRSGMSRLQTVRVSQAAAEQRRGRAGRLEAGRCYRLWPQELQGRLPQQESAEMLQADLAPLALELAQWGSSAAELSWLDAPPNGALAQAEQLLAELGALQKGRITDHGCEMMRMAAHPRLAQMMIVAQPLGLAGLACAVAALLSERDVFVQRGEVELAPRLALLQAYSQRRPLKTGANRVALKAVLEAARRWATALRVELQFQPVDQLGLLLAVAYPDRIAQLRGQRDGSYRLSGGGGALLHPSASLLAQPYLAIAQLSAAAKEPYVQIAAPLALLELETHFSEQIVTEPSVRWSATQRRVEAMTVRRLGALVLAQKPLQPVPEALQLLGLLAGIRSLGLACLPWQKGARLLQGRLNFLFQLDQKKWLDCSDVALLETLERWLAPYLAGMSRLEQLKSLNLEEILLAQLDWPQQHAVQKMAPATFQVPSGSQIKIDYRQQPPMLSARIQELFGLLETPTIANGQVALKIELLSPASRAVQLTQDLAGFWATTYHEVKKELKGRYPKHYWPDDPLQAVAIRGVSRGKRKPLPIRSTFT
ncbi:MAG: ATP-dependent helicase HrpB [Gammaproteobacteria bacterium]|nr:ATP-dependent helicase HrpB [Gammaproteobacteria bacterium]